MGIIKWQRTEPDIKALETGELYQHMGLVDVLRFSHYARRSPLVIIPKGATQMIMDHISNSYKELGGLLIGKVYSEKDLSQRVRAVEITQAVPSKDYSSTSVSLRMGAAVWDEVRELLTETSLLVGWYHSHPNLGAFFSGTDRYTQRHFFNQRYSLGIVIDPFRGERKVFMGKRSRLIEKVIDTQIA